MTTTGEKQLQATNLEEEKLQKILARLARLWREAQEAKQRQ